MNHEGVEENPLWKTLIDTVHALPVFPAHKAYVRDILMPERRNLSPRDLSERLNIPLGEALVILYELKEETSKTRQVSEEAAEEEF